VNGQNFNAACNPSLRQSGVEQSAIAVWAKTMNAPSHPVKQRPNSPTSPCYSDDSNPTKILTNSIIATNYKRP